MATTTHTTPQPHEFTFADVFSVLRRRWKIVLLTTLGCFACAAAVCILMPRTYQASGQMQVLKQSADDLRLEGLKSNEEPANDALAESMALQTQANILQSDTLALRVISKLGLVNSDDFKQTFNPVGWAMNLVSPKGPPDRAGAGLEDSPMKRSHLLRVFHKHLKVGLVPGTQLIEIDYRSRSPRVASDVVNELMRGLGDYTFETHYQATVQASHWLNDQMDDLKKQAEDSQSKVVELQREAGVYSLGGTDSNGQSTGYSATLDRLQQATQALTQATANRILKGGIYEMVREGDPESISGLAGSSLSGASQGVNNSFTLLQNLRSQQATLETQIASDESKYGDANPKLQDEKASLAGLTSAIHNEVRRIGDRANNDYHAALVIEKNLRADYESQRAAADQVNNKAVKYAIARQEANLNRDLYDTLHQHLKEASVIEGFRSSNLSIVDPARVPAKPVQPNVPVYLVLSIIGGAFFGCAGALFLDSVDGRVQSLPMIEQSLRTPLLAVIPFSEFPLRRKTRSLRNGNGRALQAGTSITPDQVHHRGALAPEPSEAFYEALGSLRTTLLLARSGAPPKVIMITSAGEGEGKSTVSLYLAAALARNRSKVLLVEADLRCPTLAERLSLSETKGLSNLLSGDNEDLIVRPLPKYPHLAFLPAGPPPPYPAVLLGSERMKALIQSWSNDFDFVLIDTPSALAVTDATVLTQFADFTLLIGRHAQSSRKSLERAYQKLSMGQEQVGVVLNGIRRDSHAYREYFGYAGDGYYGGKRGKHVA
jgi:succinoglycan biosynthesis transport protein ExoP